jgi:D-alanyl-D-alanine carboxypeptidase (penicillin-binding protein 5/6)
MPRRPPLLRAALGVAAAAGLGLASIGGLALTPAAAGAATLPGPKADIVADAGTGCVIDGTNIHQSLHTASTAKIMTALTAVERLPLNAPITVDQQSAAVEPNKWGFPVGTVWPLDKMLIPLMMVSANDAAYAIGSTLGHGDFASFAAQANATAKDLGMKDTILNDPAGLDDPGFQGGPYMSAFDLANATRNALTVPAIAQWAGTRTLTWTDPSGGTQTTINHNKMLPGGAYGYLGATGFKTGFTDRAEHTFVGTATRNGRTLIAVILGASDSGYTEAAALLDQGFATAPSTNCALGMLPPVKVSLYGTRQADQASFDRLGGGGAAASANNGGTTATSPVTSDVPAQIQGASPPRAATPTHTTLVAAHSSHHIFSVRNILILLVLVGGTTFFLRRRAVRRQRERKVARRKQRMAAIRSGGLPVVDGRYRPGLRLGQPIESHVRVRRTDDIAEARLLPCVADHSKTRVSDASELPGHRDAAVGTFDLTGHERSCARHEIQERPRNVFGFAGAPERRHRTGTLVILLELLGNHFAVLVGEVVTREVREDHPRRDRVDTDAVATDFSRQRLREHRDRGLRHAVTREGRRRRVDGTRRDVHDVARALRDHVPDRGLASVEHALQVDRENAFELLVGAFGDELVVRDAGDVAHDVDAPELALGAVDERVDLGSPRHVGALRQRGSAVGGDLVGRCLRALLVDVATDDGRTGTREHARRRLTDAARDTGENRNLARQVEEINRLAHGGAAYARLAAMQLGAETVERVSAMWARWAADAFPDDFDGVSVVSFAGRRFVRAPGHLDAFVRDDPPVELDALAARLGDYVVHRSGAAWLAYGEPQSLHLALARAPADATTVVPIGDDDPRLKRLERAAVADEWLESSVDEPSGARVGVVENDELVAVASLQIWNDAIGHLAVYTHHDARGRGLAARTASAVVADAIGRGLVPQWRARIGNDPSAAVAARLGFVPTGHQIFVRVRRLPS